VDLRRTLASFFLPGGAVLAVLIIMLRRGILVPDTQFADFCFYTAFGIGLILSLRFHSIRLCFSLLALALASRAPEALSGHVVVAALAILIPLNLAVFSLMDDRGFARRELAIRGGIFFAQFIFIAFLSRPELSNVAGILELRPLGSLLRLGVPQFAIFSALAASAIFAFRFWLLRKPIEAGFFWATIASIVAASNPNEHIRLIYMSFAGAILTMSLLESSYRMAYHDELTGLPARRAFNDALMRLDSRYALAIVDIDHFKKFNDTYGHDTGDQVLRMVASRLARVSGGGEAFRFGGEEFCIVFPRITVREALPYLERLRADVADSPFILRGKDRPVRTIEDRARAERESRIETRVTISIGVAGANGKFISVDDNLRAADKALYRAKKNGRNRVEVATASRKVLTIPPQKADEPSSPEISTPFR
jgi:diguanylate cyclase (GGDEF)-like protein